MSTNNFAIATGHPIATKAAETMLRAGGNAIDAGVAAGLALGVVHPELVSVAGVAPIILRDGKSGRITSYDGVGVWPKAANVEWFHKNFGDSVPEGILRTVVPAAPAAWIRALSEFGTMRFGDVAAPAIKAARDGFPVFELLSEFVKSRHREYQRFESTAEIFLPNGKPPVVGETFVQTDLANSLQIMVDAERNAKGDRKAGLAAARAAFYEGEIAQRITAFHAENGGLLTMEDMASYEVREETTFPVKFRDSEIYCCGAWCQGISMAETLTMLEKAGKERILTPDGDIDRHFLLEVLKRVFADREAFVTDPDYMKVDPASLLDASFVAQRLATISETRSDPMPAPGDMDHINTAYRNNAGETPEYARGSADTSHVSVIDGDGNMFSATPSDPSSDTQVIPGTGLSVSSRGSQSRAIPGHLNALAPGKRPRLTPNPILGLKDGKPWMAMGTPGGDIQIQAMAQVLIHMMDRGKGLKEAILEPRVSSYAYPGSFAPHIAYPNKVLYEQDLPDAAIAELQARGHDMEAWPQQTWKAGGICVAMSDENGNLTAFADPRRAGTATANA